MTTQDIIQAVYCNILGNHNFKIEKITEGIFDIVRLSKDTKEFIEKIEEFVKQSVKELGVEDE